MGADRPPKQVKVSCKCQRCGKIDNFEVPAEGLKKRRKGVLLVDSFPELDPARIKQLAEQVCPVCQAKEAG
jgi:hypothetical protein